jgi:hypothetical protein
MTLWRVAGTSRQGSLHQPQVTAVADLVFRNPAADMLGSSTPPRSASLLAPQE